MAVVRTPLLGLPTRHHIAFSYYCYSILRDIARAHLPRQSACIDLAGTCAPTKRALDIGADGVIYPNVETAAQLTELVKYATYPPAGVRGMGAERATAFGPAIPAVVSGNFDIVLAHFSRISQLEGAPHTPGCVLFLVATCVAC